uniref:Ig-like domain-containing protein n=1 Tax=Macrostomum lignano TaxID=282301 RepID=A0A1I8GJD6_9PLAT
MALLPAQILLLLLASPARAEPRTDCEFPVRRSRVLSTWQSSFDDGPNCFFNRSHTDEEFIIKNKTRSYRFFHSANESSADGGFHWFAVQLNEPLLIRSVTVKGREELSGPGALAENSSFIVSCTQLCGGKPTFTPSNVQQQQLCFPNGSCTASQELRVPRAQPQHAGSYICRLGSVEKRTTVAVLYPPLSVSISVQKSDNCQRLSDLIVIFSSSVSKPLPKHRCSAESDEVLVRNLTRLTLVEQSSSRDGSVSQWKLDTDERLSRALVTCSAVQTLPEGIEFRQVHSARARLSCPGKLSELGAKGHAACAAAFFGIGFAASSLLCALFRLTGVHCHAKPAQQIPGAERTEMLSRAGASAAGRPQDAATDYENSEYKLENAAGVYID